MQVRFSFCGRLRRRPTREAEAVGVVVAPRPALKRRVVALPKPVISLTQRETLVVNQPTIGCPPKSRKLPLVDRTTFGVNALAKIFGRTFAGIATKRVGIELCPEVTPDKNQRQGDTYLDSD